MNIPLCWMIAMPIIHPTLKTNVMKMEQTFQMGYRVGERVFYVSPQNWQGETKSMAKVLESRSLPWMQNNEDFEEFLKVDANLSSLCGKMFHVWDDNHRFQAWLPYINSIHSNDVEWHFSWTTICWTQLAGG